jgi:hypothetical protein
MQGMGRIEDWMVAEEGLTVQAEGEGSRKKAKSKPADGLKVAGWKVYRLRRGERTKLETRKMSGLKKLLQILGTQASIAHDAFRVLGWSTLAT